MTSLCKSIVLPYVDTNAKVTHFFPFWTIGISMYQKVLLFTTYLPQASSPLERSRQTEGQNSSPPVPKVFFHSSIGHPPHSLASPVELRLRVGPRALSEKRT
jgi:hypothetical protein